MDENEPGAGDVIAGAVLILFGICITLVSGGCAGLRTVILYESGSLGGAEELFFLALAIIFLCLGIISIVAGVRAKRPRSGGG